MEEDVCGAVRYSVSGEPVVQLYCYCTDCRKVSGTDGYAAYVVHRDDLTLEQGEPVRYSVTAKSGRTNTRNFCGKCGSRLWADLDTGVTSVAGGSLDDPDFFRPPWFIAKTMRLAGAGCPQALASLPED